MSDVQRFSDEVQRAGKNGFDAAVSSFGEANKGFQAIAAEIAAYSKKSFEDGTRAFEQLLVQSRSTRRSRSSLSTPKRLCTLGPSCEATIRCAADGNATSRSSKPLLRPEHLMPTRGRTDWEGTDSLNPFTRAP